MTWRKKGDLAFILLGLAIVWPLAALGFGELQGMMRLLVGLGPSLVLIVAAAWLFISAARR